MDEERRLLAAFVVPELCLLVVGAVMLALSFGRSSGLFTSISPAVRAAALLFVLVEIAIPVGVYLDIRRQTDGPDAVWVHAAALPVINLLGVVAYLEARNRSE
jgi:hypothetical protein